MAQPNSVFPSSDFLNFSSRANKNGGRKKLTRIDEIPSMIGTNWSVSIVCLNFIHLHELMQFRFSIFDCPITMDLSCKDFSGFSLVKHFHIYRSHTINIQRFSFFHSQILLRPIQVALRPKIIILILVWSICCTKILRSETILFRSTNSLILTNLYTTGCKDLEHLIVPIRSRSH